jgi:hypothetical protein
MPQEIEKCCRLSSTVGAETSFQKRFGAHVFALPFEALMLIDPAIKATNDGVEHVDVGLVLTLLLLPKATGSMANNKKTGEKQPAKSGR